MNPTQPHHVVKLPWTTLLHYYVIAPIHSFGLVMMLLTMDRWTRFYCDACELGRSIYEEDDRVRWLVDGARYWGRRAYNGWMCVRTEPTEAVWSCVCWVEGGVYHETYQRGADALGMTEALAVSSPGGHALWMLRTPWQASARDGFAYFMRCTVPDVATADGDWMQTSEPSRVRFLSVEYSHPAMSHPVPLEIPDAMMNVGNELFTPAFVARMLEYTLGRGKYTFDLNYTLNLMDAHLKYFTLSSQEWIRLEKMRYHVVVPPEVPEAAAADDDYVMGEVAPDTHEESEVPSVSVFLPWGGLTFRRKTA